VVVHPGDFASRPESDDAQLRYERSVHIRGWWP